MWQHPGNPISALYIGGQRWAFDVIYTPLETEFVAARERGLELLSGYELFFYHGVGAFAWTPLSTSWDCRWMKSSCAWRYRNWPHKTRRGERGE